MPEYLALAVCVCVSVCACVRVCVGVYLCKGTYNKYVTLVGRGGGGVDR